MAAEHWLVVGGGMLGMTLALRLSQHGYRVSLLESAARLGGLASAWRLGDVVWDRFYHVILASDVHLRRLLQELGLDEEIRWRTVKTGFYVDGKWYSLSNLWEFFAFPPLGWLDKLRLGYTIWHASRLEDGTELEQIPAAEWLSRLSGRRTFRRIWQPLLRAKLGSESDRVSAAFIWAIIRRMYAARRNGMKSEMFGYVPGGYARICQSFLEYLCDWDVDVYAGAQVEAVTRKGQRFNVECADGTLFEADRVIVATPPHIAAKICKELSEVERERMTALPYLGVICSSLLLKHPMRGFYITNISDERIPFTGLIEMTALVPPEDLNGYHLVYLPKYLPSHDALFDQPDRDILRTVLDGLRSMIPDFDAENIIASRVARARYVMAIPILGYSRLVPPTATSREGLYIVNSSQIVNGTLNINETVKLAASSLATLFQDSAGAALSQERLAC